MPLNVQAYTLNCGNDTPGKSAVEQIKKELDNPNPPDLILLHLQEADFDKTFTEMQQGFADKNVLYYPIGQMVTHTKLDTQFHNKTGLATYLITNNTSLGTKGIRATDIESQPTIIRRDDSRFSQGYNKGGIIAEITVGKYTIHSVNGHLDSSKDKARTQDWRNLYTHNSINQQPINDFDSLAAAIPYLQVTGADFNTRNQFKDNHSINPWSEKDSLAMQGLLNARAGRLYSDDASYDKTGGENIASKKRPGEIDKGPLDGILVSNHTQKVVFSDNTYEQAKTIDINKEDSKRDHKGIGVENITLYDTLWFNKVKNYLVSSLQHSAPELAQKINALDDNKSNQTLLYEVYNKFLAKEALLEKHLELHEQKIDFLSKMKREKNPDAEFIQKIEQDFSQNKTWFKIDNPDLQEIETIAKDFETRLALENLKLQYLQSNVSKEEKESTIAIVNNAIKHLTDEKVLDDTKKLLNFNQTLHAYDRSLNVRPGDDIGTTKQEIITELKRLLKKGESPSDTTKAIKNNIEEETNKKSLGIHRNPIIKFLRTLLDALNITPQTHGSKFAKQALNDLKAQDKAAASPEALQNSNSILNM